MMKTTTPKDRDVTIVKQTSQGGGHQLPWEVFFGDGGIQRFDNEESAYEAARRWAYACGVSIWLQQQRGHWQQVPVSALL